MFSRPDSPSPAAQQGAFPLHQRPERHGGWEVRGVPGCGPPPVALQQRLHDQLDWWLIQTIVDNNPKWSVFMNLQLFSPFLLTFPGYQQAKTVELQQRSSSVATQQTTVSSVPSHPSTTGVSNKLITKNTNNHRTKRIRSDIFTWNLWNLVSKNSLLANIYIWLFVFVSLFDYHLLWFLSFLPIFPVTVIQQK